MGPIFYVIAIMGCTDGSQACQQQRVEQVHYQTAAACQAAMLDALQRNTDLDYPVIEANCQASGPTLVRAQGRSADQRG
ncbi:MAG: hypothetical protein ACTHMG_14545 [Sphingomonas sp.]